MSDRQLYESYMHSPRWEARRARFITTTNGECACGATDALQVHHATYERLGHEMDSDLRLVCQPCHSMIHQLHAMGRHDLLAATDTVLRAVASASSRRLVRLSSSGTHTRPAVRDWRDEVRRPAWIVARPP